MRFKAGTGCVCSTGKESAICGILGKQGDTMDLTKLIISVFLGLAFSVLGFFAYIIIAFAFAQRLFFFVLLVIIYLSLIVFLFLWNTKYHGRRIYLVLLVPMISFVVGIIGMKYESYINKIPVVREKGYNIYNAPIVTLDKESTLKLAVDLPILDGATALYPVYASFAKAVYPKIDYTSKDSVVLCNKTGEAYTNLIEGKVDIIFCAAPSDEQLNMARDAGIDFTLTPIGKEAFVFFVNSNNPVNDLTVNQIKSIYSGKITKWKDIGGTKQSIRAFQRPKNSGSQTMLEKIMDGREPVKASRENVVHDMGSVINEVASYRNFDNAIGYSFLHFATEMAQNNQIKLLSINGIYPSKESIRNSTYLFADTFYAITINDDNENINEFIKWILAEQGQELVKKSGYVSINED
jgi:phosphate transport system substrate-binding protein